MPKHIANAGRKRHKGSVYYLLFLGILALGSALAIALYSGPNYMYDDIWYIDAAHLLAQGNSAFILSKFSFAFFKTVVLGLSFKILGYGNVQAILPNFAYFLITIWLVFLIGKRIDGYALGLIAALVAATTPFFVAHATRVNPDVALGMGLALILYLFFRYIDTAKLKRSTGIYLPFAIGIATSFAIYLKTEGFLIIFAVAVSILVLCAYSRISTKRGKAYRRIISRKFIVYSVIGLIAGLLIYFSVFYLLLNAPFFSIENYGGAAAPTGISKTATIVALLNPDTFFLSIQSFNPDIVPLGLVYIFALIGTLIGIRKRSTEVSFLSLVMWIIFLYLFFGPASPTRFITVPTVTRLFSAIIAPLSVLSGYFIVSVYRSYNKHRRHAKNMALLLSMFLLLLLAATNIPIYLGYHAYALGIQETRSLLSSANAELLNLSAGSNVTVYLNTSVGFRLVTFFDMRFVSNYSKYEHFFDIRAMAFNGITVYTCPSVLPAHAYLMAFLPVYTADKTSSVGNVIGEWAGSNCTLKEVWNYSEEKTYYGYMVPQTVRIYSITET